jgi:hypothetical protein
MNSIATRSRRSLSIVNPIEVLRQRLLLQISIKRWELARTRIQENNEILKRIGWIHSQWRAFIGSLKNNGLRPCVLLVQSSMPTRFTNIYYGYGRQVTQRYVALNNEFDFHSVNCKRKGKFDNWFWQTSDLFYGSSTFHLRNPIIFIIYVVNFI